MAPAPLSAKLTLSYPLYAVDFDPRDPERLVVGGGGGAGKSGVGNKITVLNAASATELLETAEVDLSKDEDSVMSLAVGPAKGKTTLIYAGINSGAKDQADGKNQHFRTFGLEAAAATKKKSAAMRLAELSRAKLFTGSEADAYQRVLRLSRPFGNGTQLGVAATGAGLNSKEPEIVLFDTASASAPPKVRGGAQIGKEAKDVDVIQTGKDEYTFAYCTEHEVFVKKISPKMADSAPSCVYVVPGSQETREKPTVPSFRCIRFLTPEFIVMLTNIWGRNGVALQVLRLPPAVEGQGRCSLAQSIRLPSSIKMATGLAVSSLSAPTSPGEPQGDGQFVVAVASTDISISLFTCYYLRVGNVQMIADLKPLQTLKSVHPLQITGIAFSNFEAPKAGTQPQQLKLASVSMGNTVVVHTIKLRPHTTKDKKLQYVATTPARQTGPSVGSLILLSMFTVFVAVIVQIMLEIRGVSPSFLGIKDYHLQPDVVSVLKARHLNPLLGPPRPVPDTRSSSSSDTGTSDFVASLLSLKNEGAQDPTAAPVVIIRGTEPHATNPDIKAGIKADLHDEAVDGPHDGKTWDELSAKEKAKWVQQLKDAGHWAEDFGETIFKGVLFGGIGGAIGAAMG